eukprot:2513756-Amphidinium_carterae.1
MLEQQAACARWFGSRLAVASNSGTPTRARPPSVQRQDARPSQSQLIIGEVEDLSNHGKLQGQKFGRESFAQ